MVYAVGYVRVSTEEQHYSPDVQRRNIVNVCNLKGWELLGVYEDIGVSGDVDPDRREGFRKAISQLEEKGGGILVAYSLDRITRLSLDRIHKVIKKLFEKNIMIYTIREDYLFSLAVSNPAFYHFLLSVLAFVSRLELELIRERTRQAMSNPTVRLKMKENFKKALIEKGKKVTLYEEIPEETKQLVADLYKRGYSYRKIAKIFNISLRHVRKILVEKGLITLPPDTCPRCFAKMRLKPESTPLKKIWHCKKCGYEKVEIASEMKA